MQDVNSFFFICFSSYVGLFLFFISPGIIFFPLLVGSSATAFLKVLPLSLKLLSRAGWTAHSLEVSDTSLRHTLGSDWIFFWKDKEKVGGVRGAGPSHSFSLITVRK